MIKTKIMKSKEVTNQILGIDVEKNNFYVCYKIKDIDNMAVIKGTKLFSCT